MGYATSINGISGGSLAYFGDVKVIIIRTKNIVPMSETPTTVPNTLKFYVPKRLVDEYKAATNWCVYADHILAIEENLDICGL